MSSLWPSGAQTSRQMEHGRSSVPCSFKPKTLSTSTSLPRLAPTNRPLSGDKLVLTQETTIVPARAMAQSMMTTSSSCPDLRKNKARSSPLASASEGDSSNNSDGGTGLLRQRVPMSRALTSRSSLRLRRQASGLSSRFQPHEHRATEETASAGVENAQDGRRRRHGIRPDGRPATRDSRTSNCSDSPASTPATPRRRAGQFSISIPNDVLAHACPAGFESRPVSAAEPEATSSGQLAKLRIREASGIHYPPPTARQRPLPSARQASAKTAGAPETIDLHSSSTTAAGRDSSARKLHSLTTQENAQELEGFRPACKSKESQDDKASASVEQCAHPSGTDLEEELTNGMAPETFDRCVRWIIDVEASKGSRPLEAIMLPPVEIAD